VSRVSSTERAAAAAVAAVAFLLAWWGLHHGWYERDQIVDLPVYERYGAAMEAGRTPYADFELEYPPLALPVFALPSLLSDDSAGYRVWFETLMAACGVAAVLGAALVLRAVGAGRARTWAALVAVAVSPLLLGSVILSRFDLWPAALTVLALAALAARRLRLGAVVLGLAIAAKLWPAVLLPLAILLARRRSAREAAVAGSLCAAAVALAYLPFVLADPGGVLESLDRQLSRPLQIESLGAGVLLALHPLGPALAVESSHGSQNLAGTGTDLLAAVLSLAQAAALVWVWASFARGPATPERLVRHAVAAVTAFVAFGKVLSPQFLIWLLPLVPLVRSRTAAALLAAACVLTQLWFPYRYWDLALRLDGFVSALVLLRGLALVALLAVLLRDTEPVPARSPSPAPSPGRT
jgi:hypothetical protein